MTHDITALLAPIGTDTIAGTDARDTETYETVAAEMEKLTSLSGNGPVDWGKVAQLGETILTTQSKDFMMAAWLSEAWLQREGLSGLSAGLQLHAGLVHQYWETGFPSLKRIRGRRNALQWWLDRVAQWLENHQPDPVPASEHQVLVKAVTDLDTGLAEKDPESPPLAGLIRQIKALDVLASPELAVETPANTTTGLDPQETDPASAAFTASGPGAEHTGATPAQAVPSSNQHANPGVTNSGQNPSAASNTAVPGVAAGSIKNTSAAHSSIPQNTLTLATVPATVTDVIKALEPAAHYLGQIGTALRGIDRFNPLVIEISRFAARCTLTSLPPAQGAATSLVAPPVPILDAFSRIAQSDNPEGLIEFCESRISAFPFWLDLDHESARGFSLLGDQGAAMRRAVIKNALTFTERLPGVENLCFSDGTPFASEATLRWLEKCRAETRGGTVSTDPFDLTCQKASESLEAGHHDEAFTAWQHLISHTSSARNRFRARLELVELLLSTRSAVNALPFIDPLINECVERDLAGWEPDLAAHAWQLKVRAVRTALNGLEAAPAQADTQRIQAFKNELEHALGQLSQLDFSEAARLS